MKISISDAIRRSFELQKWIMQNLNGLEISSEQRIILAVSCYDLVIEHQKGISVLLQSNTNGSAFALVRSLFETLIRGIWLRHCATDDQVALYVNDKLDLKFGQLLEIVEKVEGFNEGVFSELKNNIWKAMNSYTHGGILQASRRTAGAYFEANFSEEEIVDVANLANSMALFAFQQTAIEAGRLDLARLSIEALANALSVEG